MERFRQSLFMLPALFILGAILLAVLMIAIDSQIESSALPDPLTTTVESSRSILGAIAAGTITAASVVLSLTLIAVQLSSSQHSPRVLRNFIGDRFQQVIIGIVVGTFVYCVIVLRAVRAPLEDSADPVIPNLSVVVAIILGISALLAVLASVDHTAGGLKVESIARQVMNETLAVIRRRFPLLSSGESMASLQDPGTTVARLTPDDEAEFVVRATATGWVRQINATALLSAIPASTTLESRISVGAYVMEDTPMFAIRGADDMDDQAAQRLEKALRGAVGIGNERTMQQDIDFGILRLQDIGLRALSPGINDPSTAVEIVARLATVLQELVGRDLSDGQSGSEGRLLVSRNASGYSAYIQSAFDQMREAAQHQVVVHTAMLRSLGHLRQHAVRIGDNEAREALSVAAREVLDCGSEHAPLDRDRDNLERIFASGGFALQSE